MCRFRGQVVKNRAPMEPGLAPYQSQAGRAASGVATRTSANERDWIWPAAKRCRTLRGRTPPGRSIAGPGEGGLVT
jgi:hypothetical protein